MATHASVDKSVYYAQTRVLTIGFNFRPGDLGKVQEGRAMETFVVPPDVAEALKYTLPQNAKDLFSVGSDNSVFVYNQPDKGGIPQLIVPIPNEPLFVEEVKVMGTSNNTGAPWILHAPWVPSANVVSTSGTAGTLAISVGSNNIWHTIYKACPMVDKILQVSPTVYKRDPKSLLASVKTATDTQGIPIVLIEDADLIALMANNKIDDIPMQVLNGPRLMMKKADFETAIVPALDELSRMRSSAVFLGGRPAGSDFGSVDFATWLSIDHKEFGKNNTSVADGLRDFLMADLPAAAESDAVEFEMNRMHHISLTLEITYTCGYILNSH